MTTLFNDLVFNDALARRLSLLINQPTRLPKFVVFFGEPGTGKTTFAKRYANYVASDVSYTPVSENTLSAKEFDAIRDRLRSASLFDNDDKPFSRVQVIDEFHNISKNKQDKFKTFHDELRDNQRFIFVLNTEARKKSLPDVMSPAMMSRCFAIDFNVPHEDKASYYEKIKHLYPYLRRTDILANIHDHRKLSDLNSIAELEREMYEVDDLILSPDEKQYFDAVVNDEIH